MLRYGWPVRQASHRLPKRRPGRAAREADGSWRPRVESLDPRILPSFVAPANYATGGHPLVLALADLNGDGVTDLITGTTDGAVSVLLGNGNGSFQAPRITTISDGFVYSVVAADFNGDGIPDLVATNAGVDSGDPGSLSLLLGNGDGSFQAARTLWSRNLGDLAVGDFNGDGNLDLATATGKIFLGNGDGTFRAPHDVGANGVPV